MKKSSLLAYLICLFIASGNLFSQAFIQSIETIPSRECYITLMEGEEFKCKMRTALMTGGSMKSISVTDENGEKLKFKAADIKLLKVRMSGLAKMEAISEGSSSIADMMDLDFDEIIHREFVIYEQALLPKKKDKYALLQLLNPGFDERIKVYQNPMGQESGTFSVGDLDVSGGEDKSYLVVKDGEKSVKMKKNSYKKDFSEVFGDCYEMMKYYSEQGEKIKFKDMAGHVLYYNKNCDQ